MGAPHRQERYGELWDEKRIVTLLAEIRALAPDVVVSGGWAWHFMSPPGHTEFKHAHDLKDIDLFVSPKNVGVVQIRLHELGYKKTWTRFDAHAAKDTFRRYEKTVNEIKVIIDLFIQDVPFIEIDGVKVVDPSHLVGLYGHPDAIHSSSQCFAVAAARKLLAAGISPVGRKELAEIPA